MGLLALTLDGSSLQAKASGPLAPTSGRGVRAQNGKSAAAGRPGPGDAARLPCPLQAGWETAALLRLPLRDAAGQRLGGFSAVTYDPDQDLLGLLSDAPQGWLQRWRGLRALALAAGSGGPLPELQPLPRLPLDLNPAASRSTWIDAEAMVARAGALWVASEGRRTAGQPARLLRFEAGSGVLQQEIALPQGWQPGPDRGLEANQGPESLALWQRPGRADALLMASEMALRQDPPGQIRLLAWSLTGSTPTAETLQPLALPGRGGWGLTDLLVVPGRPAAATLLAMLRRFEEPDRWGARLLLYPLTPSRWRQPGAGPGRAAASASPAGSGPPLPPLHSWELLASGPGRPGLPADNWEGLAWGPPLADGRPTLLLVSDDNFNPLQQNLLALLAPRRLKGCSQR